MICLYFNAHGVGGAPKILSLKRLVKSFSLDIIFIQEIMRSCSKAWECFSMWLKDWSYNTLEFDGMSEGILMAWNSSFKVISYSPLSPLVFWWT
jgi:hypothetical protein